MRVAIARQCGAATLTLSLAILLLGTLVVFGLAQAVLMEQKIANNSLRAAQAFEAADAGMHAALDYLDDDADRDRNGSIDPIFDTNGDGTGDASTASIGNGSVAVTTQDLSTGAMTRIAVTALGYSDDRSARRTLGQTFVTLDPVPQLPRHPLLARGTLNMRGVVTVHNAHGHDAIWSGGEVQVDAGAMFTTAVPDTMHAAYPQCLALHTGCSLSTTSDASNAGIVGSDTTLSALSTDTLFRATFGLAPPSFAASLVTRNTTPAAFGQNAQLATREVVHVEGNTTIGDITIGCTSALIGNASCATDARRPSVVVIAGDAEFAGDAHLYGLLFVGGKATITRALRMRGAAVVAGDVIVASGAELDVAFDTTVLADLRKAGPITPLAGTWNEL